mmetsp:Transcript_19273/g.47656  ORF Transcript_19273/g.47656 Transcript_19273/m.47656 type:complete len:560 (-) Transcript_19273:46-1725(-)
MTQHGYDVILEMTLSVDLQESSLDPVLKELQTQVQDVMIPILVGCSNTENGATTTEDGTARHLKIRGLANELTPSSRQLGRNPDQYAIANGDALLVTPVSSEMCTDDTVLSSGQQCYVVSVPLNLYLKSDDIKYLTISGLIFDAFQGDLVVIMQLGLPIVKLKLRGVNNNTPTMAPSAAPSKCPSSAPSLEPSGNPSFMPSQSPTQQPTGIPVTGSPTKHPTTPSPTKSPTSTPTPLPTPSPSLLPSANPTGLPSVLPTKGPTPVPTTGSPSAQPSTAPTPIDSSSPTPNPTSTPSQSPTFITPGPTPGPTPNPTPPPTPGPTPTSTPPPTTAGSCVLVDVGGGFKSIPLTHECWHKKESIRGSNSICGDNTGLFQASGGTMEIWGSGYRHGHQIRSLDASRDEPIEFDFADSVTHYKWMPIKTSSCGTSFAGYGFVMVAGMPHPYLECDLTWRGNYYAIKQDLGNGGYFTSGWSYGGSFLLSFDQWYYTTITITGPASSSGVTCLDEYGCSNPVNTYLRDYGSPPTSIGTIEIGMGDNYCGTEIGYRIAEVKTTAVPA